ncbi:polysaccharide biosynthesis/export family protein [Flavobacterium aurantiibacter]|uniref:Sugar transporter n=1 Tax=Flavobacterium aurantiibacter TaxID=2023067 RepID=A0A255ZSW4_9FLAO|nr:polysaccharide biosynthesis/export family protein [Flavobacterium aurantiibacter]OYQ43965.1 sugar transporter [Flavobacterium aurantiibacter]
MRIFIVFVLVLCLQSCISVKDMVYLQKTDNSIVNPVNQINDKAYRLQSNDILMINIKAVNPELVAIFQQNDGSSGIATQSEQGVYFNGFPVDQQGNIRIPIVGNVNVIGLTLDETRLKIEQELLDKYFTEQANIFVTVKLAGLRITVNGEVGAPGTVVLFQEKANILEALANAGDILTTGDRKSVVVMRQYPTGMELHTIDLTDINALQSPYFYLQPNDYIYVKPLPQKSWGTGKTGIESLTSIFTVLTLLTTVFILARN